LRAKASSELGGEQAPTASGIVRFIFGRLCTASRTPATRSCGSSGICRRIAGEGHYRRHPRCHEEKERCRARESSGEQNKGLEWEGSVPRAARERSSGDTGAFTDLPYNLASRSGTRKEEPRPEGARRCDSPRLLHDTPVAGQRVARDGRPPTHLDIHCLIVRGDEVPGQGHQNRRRGHHRARGCRRHEGRRQSPRDRRRMKAVPSRRCEAVV